MNQTSIPPSIPSTRHEPDAPARADAGAATADGRGPNGRFCKGNKGGPGNPFARQVAAMRQELFGALTREDIATIARAMIDKAKAGDVAAARLVLQYTLGRPAAAVDPDRLDEMEWQQWQREQATGNYDEVWVSLHASTANDIARAIVPAMQKEHMGELKRQIDEREEQRREEAEEEEREAAREARRKARRAEQRSAPTPAAPAPRKEQPEAASSPGKVDAPPEEQPEASVSPTGAHEADEGGQRAPQTASQRDVERVLRMLEATVTKRAETARRAANDFDD
jgi:hypothetical protein